MEILTLLFISFLFLCSWLEGPKQQKAVCSFLFPWVPTRAWGPASSSAGLRASAGLAGGPYGRNTSALCQAAWLPLAGPALGKGMGRRQQQSLTWPRLPVDCR